MKLVFQNSKPPSRFSCSLTLRRPSIARDEQRFHVLGRVPPVGMDELDQARDGPANGLVIPLVHRSTQDERLVDRGGMRLGTQFLQDAGQVIDDEPVGIAKHPGLHPGHFPARQVAVEPIEERAVVADPGGEWAEQVRGPERDLDVEVEVPLEDHRGVGGDRLLAPRIGPGFHVVLEDLEGLGIADPVEAGDLIEGDHVPLAHQPRLGLLRGVSAEQIRHRGLAPGDQDRVRRKLAIAVRLAGAARSEFDEVVVVLDEGDEAEQDEILLAFVEGIAPETHRSQEHVNPLAGRELGPCLADLLEPAGGHLDRLQFLDRERDKSLRR